MHFSFFSRNASTGGDSRNSSYDSGFEMVGGTCSGGGGSSPSSTEGGIGFSPVCEYAGLCLFENYTGGFSSPVTNFQYPLAFKAYSTRFLQI
jgi:hypothetical protein